MLLAHFALALVYWRSGEASLRVCDPEFAPFSPKEDAMRKGVLVSLSKARSLRSATSTPTSKPPPPSAPRLAPLLKNTLAGVVEALSDLPEWTGVLAENRFEQRIVYRRAPPFADESSADRPLEDADFDKMRLWFEVTHRLVVSRRTLEDAVRIVASRAVFHPVREYLERLRWDRVRRIDRWLVDYAKVAPTSDAHAAMVSAVGRKWLLSCVARAMEPGCKVDTMLILEGRQGIGKSTALRVLAGDPYYCDSLLDIRGKDACQTIQGVWIYELSELDALLGRETSVVKAFLSRAVDRFRVPYGRAPQSVPRSVVFCGTTNTGGYLKDRSGNRRFWTVRCQDTLDTEGLRRIRDQLWAEARRAYDAGEPWHLAPEHEARMHEEHALRVEVDPWEDDIAAWVAKKGGPFTMNEVLEKGLGLKAHGKNPCVTSRVSRILEAQGYERRRSSRGRRPYFYVRGVPPSHCPT
jgi:putative DNA primase/helicase